MRQGACQKRARSEGKHWRSCSSSPSWEILPSHCPTSFASSKTQVSCVHFSGLTPGENLPFPRALIPQGPYSPGLSNPDGFCSCASLLPASALPCHPTQGLFLCPIHNFCFFTSLLQNSPQIPSALFLGSNSSSLPMDRSPPDTTKLQKYPVPDSWVFLSSPDLLSVGCSSNLVSHKMKPLFSVSSVSFHLPPQVL